jgi:hypothetical protein
MGVEQGVDWIKLAAYNDKNGIHLTLVLSKNWMDSKSTTREGERPSLV